MGIEMVLCARAEDPEGYADRVKTAGRDFVAAMERGAAAYCAWDMAHGPDFPERLLELLAIQDLLCLVANGDIPLAMAWARAVGSGTCEAHFLVCHRLKPADRACLPQAGKIFLKECRRHYRGVVAQIPVPFMDVARLARLCGMRHMFTMPGACRLPGARRHSGLGVFWLGA